MFCDFFFLMIRRPPRSTRTDTLFPTRRASDLDRAGQPLGLLAAVLSGAIEHRFDIAVLEQAGIHRRRDCKPVFFQRRGRRFDDDHGRSEEHTSELQSLMRISSAVFCLKQKNTTITTEK